MMAVLMFLQVADSYYNETSILKKKKVADF